MKVGLIIVGVVFGLFAFAGVSGVSWYINVCNTELTMATAYKMKTSNVEMHLDAMRKILGGKYKMTKEYADAFIKAVAANADGRKGGGLVKFSTESNAKIGIDDKMYTEMSNSIAGEIDNFKRSQQEALDSWGVHYAYCLSIPNSFIIGGRVKPQPEVISSEVTKAAIKTKILSDDVLN